MRRPHVLAISLPAQGHVIPLLEFSQSLVKHGFKVTFVNTEHIHKLVIDALHEKNYIADEIHLVSIPDGLEPWEDRNDTAKLYESILKVLPTKLEELIQQINQDEDEKITCVIADVHVGQAIQVAEKMKIKRAAFLNLPAAVLAFYCRIPKMIEDGIIDNHGTPQAKKQMIELGPHMPTITTERLIWTAPNLNAQTIFFEFVVKNVEGTKVADYMICNSTYDLEPAAFNLVPQLLPIGPLLASNREGNSTGYFWQEDYTCLKWLDQQPPQSVIYVAFGSFTIFNQIQFQELALGLELTNRPFLWVVRPQITSDTSKAYPEGFKSRVANRGQMVGWAPQQKVLSHPSIACFLSHCGWNSTIEGISNGLPFLCWPYCADQFLNESYICDVWKVGLKFNKSESGLITREEIKNKVDQVVGDEHFKARVLKLKETILNSVREGGQSNKNFYNLIKWMKA